MKKHLTALICCLLAVALLGGAALATGLDNLQIPTIGDLLVKHRVFLTSSGDGYTEYIVMFYSESTGVLQQFNDESLFDLSYGNALDGITARDFEDTYPGLDSMAFADFTNTKTADHISLLIRFKHLDELENCDALRANGILLSDDGVLFDADSFAELLIAGGAQELDMLEYSGLGLNFEVG